MQQIDDDWTRAACELGAERPCAETAEELGGFCSFIIDADTPEEAERIVEAILAARTPVEAIVAVNAVKEAHR